MTKKQIVALIIAIIMLVVSTIMVMKTAMEYKEAEKEYESLDRFVVKTDAVKTEEQTVALPEATVAYPEFEEEEKELFKRNYNRADFPDLDVDLEGLKEINDQAMGWLYMGSVDISYPIVQNPDEGENEYYLHHTLEGKENSSGAIFMDWEVDPELTSWNTFIYGHNMKNGSMFGSLKKLIANPKLYEKDPYIYIFRDEGIYRYKIYSFYLDATDSKMYWTCDTLKEYRAYIRTALEQSIYDCETETSEELNSVTLVTCSGSGASKKRFFVHGIIQDRYLYTDAEKAAKLTEAVSDEGNGDNN